MKYTELNEKKRHGSADFPIQYYFVTQTHPQYEMQPHWHREFEMIRVISGVFRVFLNNVEYELLAGDIALVNCGVLHRGEPENCVYECVVFDLSMLRRRRDDAVAELILPLMNGTHTANGLLHRDHGILYVTAASLFSLMQKPAEYYELSVYGALFRLFALLYRENRIAKTDRGRRTGKQNDTVITLLDWIETHYTEPVTLAQLAAVSGLNEKYLCRLFKEFTDRTPIDYVNHLRIEHACHEITVNHRTVTEAAFEVGFNDLSYFSRTFKKYKGVSPKAFAGSGGN